MIEVVYYCNEMNTFVIILDKPNREPITVLELLELLENKFFSVEYMGAL